MDVTKIIAAITGGATLLKELVAMAKDAKAMLSEDDAQKIDDALAKIQAENDVLFDRVSGKLADAAKRA